MSETGSMLFDLFILLLVALLTVPAARRLGFVPALGFLVAGVLIGPWGLALIRDAERIRLITEFGTVALLFLVALQVTPARVTALWKERAWLGGRQAAITVLVVTVVALIIGLPWHHAVVSGLAFTLSSGAIATRVFDDRYPTGSPLTDAGRQVLLMHSLMMIPILIFMPLLGFDAFSTNSIAWSHVITSVVVFVFIALFGPLLLEQAFRLVVGVGLDEVFAAFASLIVIGLLLLMRVFDLPLEVGALLAGLLLARSEYGSAVDNAVQPFRLLLVGVFFLCIGMAIDFTTFTRKPSETLALVALLVLIKVWVMRTLLRFSAVPRRQRVWLATVLSQSGELSFVVISYALAHYAIPVKLGSQLVLVVALSMLLTPILLNFVERRDKVPSALQRSGLSDMAHADSQVIVAGFGRVGQVIARLLRDNDYRVAIIDHNPDRFAELRGDGFIGFYGDALRPDLLEAAGARHAAVLVIAIDDPERASELVARVRREHLHLLIVSRAVDTANLSGLLAIGADRVHRETFESALLMGEDVLELVGASPLEAQAMTEAFRDAEAV